MKYNRPPKYTEVPRGLTGAIKKGRWKKFGFDGTKWNEFLRYCNFNIKLRSGNWKGQRGLERAKQLVLNYFKTHGCTPNYNDIPKGILSAIERGKWKKFGFIGTKWNDFLRYCKLDVKHNLGRWKGQKGLENAVKLVLQLYEKKGHTPNFRDVPGGLKHAIIRDEWRKFGVNSWKDLLGYCNLEVKVERGKWTGEKGLKHAIQEVINFHEAYGRTPTKLDVSTGIFAAVKRKEWKNLEVLIESWNDLIRYCGLCVNFEPGKWKYKGGLQRAKDEILFFYAKNGFSPTSDAVSSGIRNSIYNEIWESNDIRSWADLLLFCGLEPRRGIFGDLWKKWEEWCEKVVCLVYPTSYKLQPATRLDNNKVPDFNFNKNGNFVIGDAKLNMYASRIEDDIENYLDYCDWLEFWCLFGEREPEIHKSKNVYYFNPQQILSRIKDDSKKRELKNQLDEIYSYAQASTLKPN